MIRGEGRFFLFFLCPSNRLKFLFCYFLKLVIKINMLELCAISFSLYFSVENILANI